MAGHAVVDREQRLAHRHGELRAVVVDVGLRHRRRRADRQGLVGDVGLVERRDGRGRHVLACRVAHVLGVRCLSLVRGVVAQVEEQRIGVGRGADELVTELRDHRGLVRVGVLVPEADALGAAAAPQVPARGHVGRLVRRVVAVEVLADESRVVAGVVEPRGDGLVLEAGVVEPLEPSGRAVVVDAVGVGELPAQDRGSRRAAQRHRREGLVEQDAVGDELALHGRHPRQLVRAHVVGDDEHDVRAAHLARHLARRRPRQLGHHERRSDQGRGDRRPQALHVRELRGWVGPAGEPLDPGSAFAPQLGRDLLLRTCDPLRRSLPSRRERRRARTGPPTCGGEALDGPVQGPVPGGSLLK